MFEIYYFFFIAIVCVNINHLISAVKLGNSEVVNIPTMGLGDSASYLTIPTSSGVNCPHLQSGLVTLTSQTAGSDVTIASGSSILLKQSSLPSGGGVLGRVTVQQNAVLIFNDENIDFRAREIVVNEGGKLFVGSQDCRINNFINITFYGSATDSSQTDPVTSSSITSTTATSKGLLAYGQVDIHGKQYHPTWTRLATTASSGTSTLYLQEGVNWEVGQQVVITTTVLYDCPDQWKAAWCNNQPHQNEKRTIASVSMNAATQTYIVQLTQSLAYSHYAGKEYQAEVALLSRRILIKGQQTNDNFGGHTKVIGTSSQGRFSGVQAENMGQLNIMARYPFHFHMMLTSAGTYNSYFQDSSVTNSNFRCFTVHGTNNTRVSRNVAYNAKGMCYYFEDGVEENNLVEYNIAIMVAPIYAPANGDWGQGGQTFTPVTGQLLVPVDTSAAGFYLLNGYNTIIGNAASGGWTGFAFPNALVPIGNFQGRSFAAANPNYYVNPLNRPIKKFYGNTAHSSGFYWKAHGSCLYVGAELKYDATNSYLIYNSGRNDRDTYINGTVRGSTLFENTKVFLCNKGIAHWGNNVQIEKVEMHDVAVSAMMFGSAAMYNVLVDMRTGNPNGIIPSFGGKMGFQFYDTWVQTILSNMTFRHVSNASATACAIRYMDHSDHYSPQGINSIRALKFQDVIPKYRLCLANCGPSCGWLNGNPNVYNVNSWTMSSKLSSILDFDGSLLDTGGPTMIGSNLEWWKSDNTCTFRALQNVWTCPWSFKGWNVYNPQSPNDKNVVSVFMKIPGLMDGCDSAISSTCTDQYSAYTVGRVSKWGSAAASSYVDLSPFISTMSGVTGPSNMGWYWRPKSVLHGIDGAPSRFTIENHYQMVKTTFVVLAIAYPAGTQFTMQQSLWGNNLAVTPMASSLSVVLSPTETVNHPSTFDCSGIPWYENCKNTGGGGFSWYFDNSYLYLRIVPFGCYNLNQMWVCVNNDDSFNAYGAKVGDVNYANMLTVDATCPGCTIQKTFNGIKYYSVADAAPLITVEGTASVSPSAAPVSKSPSIAPTKTPSKAPSNSPTISPTVTPSKIPSRKPSIKPSVVPTLAPILQSISPSFTPSLTPSFGPISKSPSLTPTKQPLSPSRSPSSSPSTNPSKSPSIKPSYNPTIKQSGSPSSAPVSKSPSITPSASPIVTNRLSTSEVVNIPTMTLGDSDSYLTIPTSSGVNCPHLQSSLVTLTSQTAGSDVTIASGSSILLKQSSLPSGGGVLGRVTVQQNAVLIFNDENIDFRAREIVVKEGGKLFVGSQDCRINNFINITFYGSATDSSQTDPVTSSSITSTTATSKGLLAYGQVDIHGKQYHPTWTRLATTASSGTSTLYLQEGVNWEVGQQVVITTTVLYDCPDQWKAAWCNNQPHQNEKRTIASVSMNAATQTYIVQLTQTLAYSHYAGKEYQAEVALLSRRILIKGQQTNDNFGGHTKVIGTSSQGRFSGVQAENMGQLNIMARYPFHFHMMLTSAGTYNSYFQDSSVTNSNFRCFTVHGTNNTRVSRNVAYNAKGMCYYFEDGVEENNLVEYNIAIMVAPIYAPANGDWGQGGQTFTPVAGQLLVPVDTSAAGFYFLNGYNTIIGNAASGGWTGFAFPNALVPVGVFQGRSFAAANPNYYVNPLNRPIKKFYGNTAHSSGFYWKAHGSCLYVGAELKYDATNSYLIYNSGRNDRDTYINGTVRGSTLFENTKVFLCNKGIAHWGNDVQITQAEMHDVAVSAMMFGSAAMYNVLVDMRTGNPNGIIPSFGGKMGFQFYDTWVQTILSNVTFRHVSNASATTCAIRYMDHSDHYSPQGINSIRALKFQDVIPKYRLCLDKCGPSCNTNSWTMSSKLSSILDFDGSLLDTGGPTMIGSNLEWWKSDNTCTFRALQNVWTCPWSFKGWNVYNPQSPNDKNVVSVFMKIPGLMDGCDSAISSTCTDQYSAYTVGRVSKWGSAAASSYVDLSPFISTMSGVTGPSNMGWYWRPKSVLHGIDGAPSHFTIENHYQMVKTTFVVLAIAYPAGTQFTMQQSLWGNNLAVTPMASSLSIVLSPTETVNHPSTFDCSGIPWYENCKNTGGGGFSWYFDNSYLYLRIVPFGCYNKNKMWVCVNNDDSFNAYGAKVGDVNYANMLTVDATCPGCTIQKTFNAIDFYSVADAAPLITVEGATSVSPSMTPVSKSPSFPPSVVPVQILSSSSKSPSVFPSMTPITPSLMPTMTPITPSLLPTMTPITPSLMPTMTPIIPSLMPTMTPIIPSLVPTKVPITPSLMPTMTPITPSLVPTKTPIVPSVAPTKAPITPSRVPTRAPSAPTRLPTKSPISPSRVPTKVPTKAPSRVPTKTPIAPSRVPTKVPTKAPSRVPTKTPIAPSRVPTKAPLSKAPTRTPTSPTVAPSKVPTIAPVIAVAVVNAKETVKNSNSINTVTLPVIIICAVIFFIILGSYLLYRYRISSRHIQEEKRLDEIYTDNKELDTVVNVNNPRVRSRNGYRSPKY